MMLHSQSIVVLQKVFSVRFRIIQMKMDRVEKRRVLGVAVVLMLPHGLFGESFLLVLFQESR